MVVACDASTEQYPDNTPSSFKMQLPSQVHLSEDWEVAMTHNLQTYLGKHTHQPAVLSFTLQW